jgi:hypothetical protein
MSRTGVSKTCAEAFDGLNPPNRLALLEILGFDADEIERASAREERELRYDCLMYEVQEELRKCYIKGEWKHPETKKQIKP